MYSPQDYPDGDVFFDEGYEDYDERQMQFPGGFLGIPGFNQPGQGPGFRPPGFPGFPGFPPGGGPGFPPGQQPGFPPGQQPGRPPFQAGPPSSPPPNITPKQAQASVFKIDPGSIRGCLFRFTFVWLNNRQRFWFYPVFVGRRSVSGYRWNGFMWVYFGIDLRRIESFQCF